jgi:FKBP-type peptidyl-prolyl cis-trans isomerase FkpA
MLKQILIFLLIPVLFAGCLDIETPPLTAEEQLAVDIAIITNYLTENNIEAEFDERGFFYVVHDDGNEDGASPTITKIVRVKYEGKLLSNGNVFDSNDSGVSFQLQNLILGWQYGLPLMKEGAIYTFYFTSGLGYGRQGSATIPPNANITFRIELLQVI